jgi:hypothetical protein
MAKSEAMTACRPSCPLIPMPTSAICIIDTSFAPTKNEIFSHLMKTSIFVLKRKGGVRKKKDTLLPNTSFFFPHDRGNRVSRASLVIGMIRGSEEKIILFFIIFKSVCVYMEILVFSEGTSGTALFNA